MRVIGYNGSMSYSPYDLHSHSTASDGTLSPADLVASAHAAGVAVLALTDHDELTGIQEASAAADACGIGLVNGIELSVTWHGMTLHIVGLAFDREDSALLAGLERQHAFRHWRAEEMGRRLARHRIEGGYEGARTLAKGPMVSRTHFARWLVAAGHVRDMEHAFSKFLRRGGKAHVPGEWASLSDVVGWIRGAGGDAVLAHPARYDLSATRRRQLLEAFVAEGGNAIEVISGRHGRDDSLYYAQLARHYALAASIGSDFHTPESYHSQPGRLPLLPADLVPVWADATRYPVVVTA
jgi:3',5'-nucleoside bisphosphate phosphatase